MPQSKEVHKEYMRRRREGSQDKGAQTEVHDAGQQLHKGAAPGAKILSDGQLWYPGNNGYHPIECRCQAHPDRTTMDDSAYYTMTHIL